jgi:hypothetical protein
MRPGGTIRLAAVLATAAALSGRAAAEENRWTVHFQPGVLLTLGQPKAAQTTDMFVTTGVQLRLAVEYSVLELLGVELGYGANLMFHDVSNDIAAQQLIIAGVRVRPWHSKTGGYLLPQPLLAKDRHKLGVSDILSDAWIDAHVMLELDGAATRFGYDVGIGTRVPIFSPFQAGLFVRFQHLVNSGVFYQLIVGLELGVGFLPVKSEPDDDDDGVPNSADNCPGTEHGVRVNRYGCPVREDRTTAPKCSDSDLDGVCDGQDDCPDTKPGVAVDKHGCPGGGGAAHDENPAP